MKQKGSVHKGVHRKPTEVGIREFRANLRHWLERARAGQEIVITERGKPIVRMTSAKPAHSLLDELIAAGVVHPPKKRRREIREDDLLDPIPGFSLSEYLIKLRG